MNQQQALTIINQLGGNRFRSMTGAKDFVYGSGGLTFKIGRNCHDINGVHIQLEPSDLYTVEFLRVKRKGISVVARHEDVFCADLPDIFTRETGMYTTLY